MASTLAKNALKISRRNIFTSSKMLKEEKRLPLPDPIEHMTGVAKRQFLAEMSGNPDPFNVFARKHGEGTKDKPNEVPSAYESRLIGCICTEDQAHIKWMWVHKGDAKRCACGSYFKLVYAPPV